MNALNLYYFAVAMFAKFANESIKAMRTSGSQKKSVVPLSATRSANILSKNVQVSIIYH
jgi:hypothetical protein